MSPVNISVVGLTVAKLVTPPPCRYSVPPVPAIDLFIFILLGSVALSVQNSKSSITLIPVIILFLSKCKTLSASKDIVAPLLTEIFLLNITSNPIICS